MDKLKKAYFYFFYKFYKFGFDPGPFSRQFSAMILIVILETSFVISMNCYYIEFFDRSSALQLYSLRIILPLLAVVFLNYFTLIKDDIWKNYIQEFDKWPKYKNVIGSCIVILIVGLAIFSMQYSLSTMRQISTDRH